MHDFASGRKRNYYGKADVIAYRLNRDGRTPPGAIPVFGANVTLLIYGDAFWPTYTTGDNTGLIATDSMKNFIQRETLNFPGRDLESYCRFLAGGFLETYPQVEGAQIRAAAIPYEPIVGGNVAFAPGGPEVATARLELRRSGADLETVELRSGIQGFRLLRLGGSAFHGFVRDQYTTLPDIHNRPLHMWLTWTGRTPNPAPGTPGARLRRRRGVWCRKSSTGLNPEASSRSSIRLAAICWPEFLTIAEVSLEGQNRTWDTVAESGDTLGVYTDARPPYGCLGLTLRR